MCYQPTSTKRTSWLVNPLDIRWYWIFAAILPALLATILIFMDQQITAVIVNRKENKLLVSNLCIAVWLLIVLRVLYKFILVRISMWRVVTDDSLAWYVSLFVLL